MYQVCWDSFISLCSVRSLFLVSIDILKYQASVQYDLLLVISIWVV